MNYPLTYFCAGKIHLASQKSTFSYSNQNLLVSFWKQTKNSKLKKSNLILLTGSALNKLQPLTVQDCASNLRAERICLITILHLWWDKFNKEKTVFLKWKPCHSPVMIFWLFRPIYLGSSKWFFKCADDCRLFTSCVY